MKQILRLFVVVGVVLLTALISAGSCDTDGDGDKKNTNNNGGGGTVTSPLKITPVDTIAKVTDKTIYLKASAFPATAAATASEHFNTYNATANANTKAFDIEIDKATGGMVVVANGNILGVTDVTTPARGAIPADATGNKGVHVHLNASGTPVGTLAVGANIFSVFAEKTAIATGTVDAKKAPFAFSATGGADDTQPILWCVSTITGIAATAAATKLTGGQKASCYVASVGAKAIGGTANAAVATAWFAKAAPFKREFAVGIAGVRTDATTLDKIGLTAPAGTADAAKDGAILTAFENGVDKAEMKAIVETAAKNGLATHVGFKAYTIKIVKDADFK